MASEAYRMIRGINPQIRMEGVDQELSYYDLVVLWHWTALGLDLSVGNAAHSGPIFLPWHRMYMLLVEQWMRIMLDDSDFGLPYWDWAADGELPQSLQWRTQLWMSEFLGESRARVVSGTLARMRVRLDGINRTQLRSIQPRPLERNAGADREPSFRTLPTQGDITGAMAEPFYDRSPWGPDRLTVIGTGSRGGLKARGSITGSTSRSVVTWGPGRRRTTRSSFSITATSTGCGKPGWSSAAVSTSPVPAWARPDIGSATRCSRCWEAR